MTQQPGLFDPESVTWKVWLGPTVVPALIYSGMLFVLHQPMAVIGEQSSEVYADTLGRTRRSFEYFHITTFGDKDDARQAATQLNGLHDQVRGRWPVTDREYCASEAEHALWFLAPFVQGMLDAYAAYGLEPLTAEERDQMWREQMVMAELNRIPAEMFPKSQADADDYLAQMRPLLAANEQASRAIAFTYPTPWNSEVLPPVLVPLTRVLVESGTALLPDYALKLIRQERPAIVKRATIAAYRPIYQTIARTPVLRDAIANALGEPSRTLVSEARAARSAGTRSRTPSAGSSSASAPAA